ncbi:MAG: choice-of-anchor D domain-containing protein [Candidatus Cloacimonetes bacterium]|nr:choice-of-anchor D domain-containing protein [Candidatus Cloacimonadota bacterium]
MKKGIILLLILICTVSWTFAGSTTQEITTAKLRIEEIYTDGSVDLDEVADLKRSDALVRSNAAITTDALPHNANASLTRGSVTIGAGGTVSGTYDTGITPFGTYYEDGQNQILFTAAELSTAGLPAGSIVGLGWNVNSASTQTMNGFNIEIKHTTATSVTGWETGFTNVYSGTHVAATGWNDFTFTAPFVWNEYDNILIKVCYDNTSYSSNSLVYFDSYPGTNGSWYNDYSSGCSDPYGYTPDGRPQTRFEYISGDTCDDAIAIGEVTDFPFNTAFATASMFGGYITSKDLWYEFTAPDDGSLYVGVCGSSFDTYLVLWGECDPATMIAENDDSCGLQSELFNIPVVSGEDYYIQIGGYSSYSGPGILDVTFTTIPIITVNPLSMDEYLNVGETSTQILNIANSGSADLTYNLSHNFITDRESSAPRNYGDYADRSRISSSEINFLEESTTLMKREFPDNRAAGDILGTYYGLPPIYLSNMGMVWVGDLLYSVDYNLEQLNVYDITIQSIINTYPLHSMPFGITWDGMYLWIGDGLGNVYAYNLDGSSAAYSFSCPDSQYPTLTWDGDYFITCPIVLTNPTIYKLDVTGTIIDSYTGSLGMDIWQIVWVPEHTGGNLWMTNTFANAIVQLNLVDTDGTYSPISSFALPPGEVECYAITHYNNNLWWADWDSPLYEIDDGIMEGWLSYDIYSGTLAPGANIDVTITFDATDIYGGTYLADLTVNSNDPMTPQVIVPIMLDVTGEPDIDTDVVSIDFGPLQYGQYATDSFTITNVGTDWLDVSDIVCDNSSFTFAVAGSTTEDITIDVTVDSYYYEASWNVWNYTTSSYYFASNQTFSYSYQSTSTTIPLEPGLYSIYCWDSYGDGGIAGTVTDSEANVLVSWGAYSYSSFGAFDFNIDSSSSFSLYVDETKDINVMFSPTTNGTITGTLTIYSNDPDELEYYIALSGEGLVPEIATNPTLINENLFVNETSTQILTIESNGPAGAPDLNAVITIETSAEEYFQSFLQFPQYEQREHIVTERTTNKIKKGYPDKFQQLTGQLDSRSIIFSDDMESGVGGWTTQVYGVDDLWHQTNLSFNSPISSWWCGIEAQGNYETGNTISTALISPAIDLTTISLPVGLYFYEAYDTEPGYDNCMVDVTTDGGSSWIPLRGAYGSAPSGYSGGWIFTALDLTPYLGNLLQIRFYFDTGDPVGNFFTGWFVDDVLVTAGNPLIPWLSVDTYNVTIPSTSTADINVNFDTSGMYGGTYTADIILASNAPDNPILAVPVTLDVTGIPDITVDPISIDFGAIFAGATTEEIFTVSSTGSDDLIITDITSDNPDFYCDVTTYTISPENSEGVIVSFNPSTVGIITGILTVHSNDPNDPEVYINLTGEGTEPPVIVVTPASIDVNIAPDVTVDNTLTIENTGLVDLNYAISIEYIIPTDRVRNYGDYADRSRVSSSEIDLSNRMNASRQNNFSINRAAGDVLGTYTGMPMSNTGMVWVGDLLYIIEYDYYQLAVYDISTQSLVATYPIHGSPYGITWDGTYLWIGDNYGNVYAYNLDGTSAGFSFSCPFGGFPVITWDGSYFIVAAAWTMDNIYRVNETGTVIDTYINATYYLDEICWAPEHANGNIWATTEYPNIMQINLNDGTGEAEIVSQFDVPTFDMWPYGIDHHNFNLWWSDWDGPLYEIDDGIAEFSWLSIDITSGTLGTGISDNITVTIDANEVDSLGVYEASLVIVSNDPVDPVVYVPVTLTVNYPPEIVLPDDFTFDEDDGLMVDFDAYITDLNSSPYVLSVAGNSNVTVDIVGSEVTFGAAPDWFGTETLTFTVDDGQTDSDVVDIIVLPVNDPPTIVLPDDFTFDEDDVLVVDFTQYVDDIDLDVLTLTVTGNTEITVDIVDLEVTFGATENWNGTETLTFTVDDGQGDRVSFTVGRRNTQKRNDSNSENSRATAEDVVDIIVLPVNDDPTIVLPDDFTFDEDDELIVDFTQYVDDIDLDVLTLSVTGNTEITVNIVDLEVTFGATENWNGSEILTFTVDDGQGDRVSFTTGRRVAEKNEDNNRATAEDDVEVIVLPVNDPPTIVLPDDFTFEEDDGLIVDFTEFIDDVDPDDLTLSVTGNIEITVDIVGFEVTFGATENWNGTETLTFIVDDNVTRATAEDDVDVIVTPVNDAPVLIGFLPEDLEFTVVEDSTVTFSVDVEDIDSTIDYEWFVNDVLQTESTEEFVHIFEVVGDIEIKSVASDEEYEIETIWIVHVEPGSDTGNELIPIISYLDQNYPNPFNPTTTIKFDIKENESGNLSIYNMKGQLVFTKSFGAGHHNFLWDAASCSSGIYFYKLVTPSYFHTRKMILLK